MRYQLKAMLEDGDCFYTGFSISNRFLETKTPQQIVDEFYVGTRYSGLHQDLGRMITKVEILGEGTPV